MNSNTTLSVELSNNRFLFLVIIIQAFEKICSLRTLAALMHKISKANFKRHQNDDL
jgi:hypothetical protein